MLFKLFYYLYYSKIITYVSQLNSCNLVGTDCIVRWPLLTSLVKSVLETLQ